MLKFLLQIVQSFAQASVLALCLAIIALPTNFQGLVQSTEATETDGDEVEAAETLAVTIEQSHARRQPATRVSAVLAVMPTRRAPAATPRSQTTTIALCDAHNGCGAILRC